MVVVVELKADALVERATLGSNDPQDPVRKSRPLGRCLRNTTLLPWWRPARKTSTVPGVTTPEVVRVFVYACSLGEAFLEPCWGLRRGDVNLVGMALQKQQPLWTLRLLHSKWGVNVSLSIWSLSENRLNFTLWLVSESVLLIIV